MRRLFPVTDQTSAQSQDPADREWSLDELAEAYAYPPLGADGHWLRANMVSTLDGAALYVNNGKVDSSWYSDNAKLYVETMKEWHDKGYIYNDILSVTTDRNDATDRELNFSGGDYFMFSDQAGHYGDFFTYDLPEG